MKCLQRQKHSSFRGSIAQGLEHWSSKPGVVSSNLTGAWGGFAPPAKTSLLCLPVYSQSGPGVTFWNTHPSPSEMQTSPSTYTKQQAMRSRETSSVQSCSLEIYLMHGNWRKGTPSNGIWSLRDPADFVGVIDGQAGVAARCWQSELVHLFRQQQEDQIMAPELSNCRAGSKRYKFGLWTSSNINHLQNSAGGTGKW